VVIGVSDDGSGLPPDLAAPFEPKRRGHSASAGAGLGLSIAHGIVVAHSGQIRPRRPAKGTRFEIRLPVEAAGGAGGSPPADGATPDRATSADDAALARGATPGTDTALADGATRGADAVPAGNGATGGAAGINGVQRAGAASLSARDAAIGKDAAMGKRAGNGRPGRPPGQPRPARGARPADPAGAGGRAAPAMTPAPGPDHDV
jgi:hypothetical protein